MEWDEKRIELSEGLCDKNKKKGGEGNERNEKKYGRWGN